MYDPKPLLSGGLSKVTTVPDVKLLEKASRQTHVQTNDNGLTFIMPFLPFRVGL
jgi:hypothetical protein